MVRPRCISRSGCPAALSCLAQAQTGSSMTLARTIARTFPRVPEAFLADGRNADARVGEAWWALEKVASEVGRGRDSGVTASDSLGKLWGCRRGGQRGRCAPINIAAAAPAQTLLISPSLGLGRMDGKYDHIKSRIVPNAQPICVAIPIQPMPRPSRRQCGLRRPDRPSRSLLTSPNVTTSFDIITEGFKTPSIRLLPAPSSP